MKIKLVAIIGMLGWRFVFAQAELSYFLPSDIQYDASIPTPSSVLGYQVGEWHVTHDKLIEYMKVLDAASDRISLEVRGYTFERHPLVLLTITSPTNHAKLDPIRIQHLKLMSAEGNSLDLEEMPIVVQQGFSIHGNEPSGSNAGLLVAYYLAAAQGPEIEDLLRHTVILLDPSYNPDGLQRFAHWANTNRSMKLNPDSNDREFNENWPGGRTNHYWFDLNRDWMPAQMPESRARLETFHKWMPNILTDHHEMGTNSTFFFQPGVPARTHPLTPPINQELTKEIAQYHISALNKIGSLYFSEEGFDDFYYGKGSTFPDIQGSIGILFEQASARGHLQESDNGTLSFPFAIRNQVTTALSTLEAAKNMRVKLLSYFRNFYEDQRKESAKNKAKGIIFGDEKDLAKTVLLAEILDRQQVKLQKVQEPIKVGDKIFQPESSYIIPLDQAKYRLIRAMFEKRTQFQDSIFYDISAWTFPLAFNVDYAELSLPAYASVAKPTLPVGKVTAKSNYAYLLEWHEYYTPKALHAILNKGLRAKVGRTPFKLENRDYDYGTILIPVQNQNLSPVDLYDFLGQVAQESHLTIYAVGTGNSEGIDLGSNDFEALHKVKIAMIVGDGIVSYDAGEIWHVMDTRYEMSLTKIDQNELGSVDLSSYDVILIPDSYQSLDKPQQDKLKNWVKEGGTLIGFGETAKWLAKGDFIHLKFREPKVEVKDVSYEQSRNFRGAQVIGGAIFKAKADRSHPLNWGYSRDHLPLFRSTTVFIEPDSVSYRNPLKYVAEPLESGYISEENLAILKGSVPFQSSRLGKGRVMVFTDNPNFRAFWYGTNKLMMNAIFFRELF